MPDAEFPDVHVQGLVRKRDHFWSVTLFLVNGQQEPKKLRDTAWMFQPELIVESPDQQPFSIAAPFRKIPVKAIPSRSPRSRRWRCSIAIMSSSAWGMA